MAPRFPFNDPHAWQDSGTALIALTRLKRLHVAACEMKRLADDTDEPDQRRRDLLEATRLAGDAFSAASALMMSLPIGTLEDVAAKADFGARLCDSDDDRRTVLSQIYWFFLDPTMHVEPYGTTDRADHG